MHNYLMLGFAVISAVVSLIPNAIGLIDSIFNIFGGNFRIGFISDIIDVIDNVLNIAEKVLFLMLGAKALNMGTVRIPAIDRLIKNIWTKSI